LGRTQPLNSQGGSIDLPHFHATLPLTAGPSRVVVGDIINPAGERELRVFAICFDSRLIFIIDPATDRVEAEIFTGRGPHAMVIDAEHGLGYVGHFTDSYIGVVSLDQRFPRTFGTIVATVGTPTPPRATK
jgi:DNA-binding beta-propeller fold protein YncE